MLWLRFAYPARERVDQVRNLPVTGRNCGQTIRIIKSCGEIPGITVESGERMQGIPVGRVFFHAAFEDRDRLIDSTCGMQADGIDISELRLIRRELASAS